MDGRPQTTVVCSAHLLRDTQYAIDAGDDRFRARRHDPVEAGHADRTATRRSGRRHLGGLSRPAPDRLDALLAIVPATKAGQKLQRIIKRFRQNLFVFITNRAVPPTNNGAEQALAALRRLPQGHQRLPVEMGRLASTPMSGRFWRPRDDAASASSTPCA